MNRLYHDDALGIRVVLCGRHSWQAVHEVRDYTLIGRVRGRCHWCPADRGRTLLEWGIAIATAAFALLASCGPREDYGPDISDPFPPPPVVLHVIPGPEGVPLLVLPLDGGSETAR